MWKIACLSQESRVSFESGPAVWWPAFTVTPEAALVALRELSTIYLKDRSESEQTYATDHTLPLW